MLKKKTTNKQQKKTTKNKNQLIPAPPRAKYIKQRWRSHTWTRCLAQPYLMVDMDTSGRKMKQDSMQIISIQTTESQNM